MPGLGDLDFVAVHRQQAWPDSYVSIAKGWAAAAKGGVLVKSTCEGFRFKAVGSSAWTEAMPAESDVRFVSIGPATGISWPSLGVALPSACGALSVALNASLLGGAYGRAKTWGILGGYDGDASNDMVLPNGQLSGTAATGWGSGEASAPWKVEAVEEWGAHYRVDSLPGASTHLVPAALAEDVGGSAVASSGRLRALTAVQQSVSDSDVVLSSSAMARVLFSMSRPTTGRRVQACPTDSEIRAACGIPAGLAQSEWTGPQALCYGNSAVTCDTSVGAATALDSSVVLESRVVVDYNASFVDPASESAVGVVGTLFSVVFTATAPSTAGSGAFVIYTASSTLPAGASFGATTGIFTWQLRDVDMQAPNGRAPGAILSLPVTVTAVTRFANGSVAGGGRPNAQRTFTIYASATPLPPSSTPSQTPNPTITPSPSPSKSATPSAAATVAAVIPVDVRPAGVANPGGVVSYSSPAR